MHCSKKGLSLHKREKNLKKALQQVLALRCEAHVFYQKEEEFLLQVEESKIQDPHFLYLDEKRLAMLHEIYKVLIPFHCCAEEFLSTRNQEVFNNKALDDDSLSLQGKIFEKTLQYSKAQEAFQQAVSLNPNDLDALLWLGGMEGKIGNSQEALTRNLRALELAKQKYGENHSYVAISYDNIGCVYSRLGHCGKALEHCQKALNIRLQLLGESNTDVARSLDNIGSIYDNLKNYKKALEYYQKALKIELQISGENHLEVATIHNNIGTVYDSLGVYEKALEHHQIALKIRLQKWWGENHSEWLKATII